MIFVRRKRVLPGVENEWLQGELERKVRVFRGRFSWRPKISPLESRVDGGMENECRQSRLRLLENRNNARDRGFLQPQHR